ncbi:MAG TPA: CHAT domain-containing protein [Thermoanaerobaculia bacterium]|nr:CHAT domain-containing protein [Thermoanaerobaculia bacterium]
MSLNLIRTLMVTSACLLQVLFCSLLDPAYAAGSPTATGVVVEEVTPRSLGALADLQPGDVLFSWCRAADVDIHRCLAEGLLASPFDLAEIEIEQVPRGGVRVAGRRGGESAIWNLLPGPLGVEVGPDLQDPLKGLHREAQDLAAAGDLDRAAERWRAAAAAAEPTDGRLSEWFLWRAASLLSKESRWAQADALFADVLEKALQHGGRPAAWLLLTWGQALQKRAPAEAEDYFRRALELYQRLGPEDLAIATIHHRLCTLAMRRDLNAAEASCRQALTMIETLAPHSFALSAILNSLGAIALERGDLPAAERFFQRALALDEEIAPGSLASVLSLQENVIVASGRSDFATAEDLLRREKAILDEAEPNGLRFANVLSNMGNIAAIHGDLETASDLLRRSLEINERLDPSGSGIPAKLYNLGVLAAMREDLETAQRYMQRALELSESENPESSLVTAVLKNLGNVMQLRGDVSAARELFQRALTICEKVRPFSLATAAVLNSLGTLVTDDGDLAVAEGYFRRAATIQEKLAPGTSQLANTLYNLGRANRLRRRFDSAAEFFCRAVDTLEIQRGKLGGTDTTPFGVTTASFYAACVGTRIETGKHAEAFRILESGRARTFLERLGERDVLAASELPAGLASRREELNSDYDDTQSALSDLDPIRDEARIEELHASLREIRGLQAELAARVRRESPRYASLYEPQTLDLGGARRALDSGTVFLSYAVDEETTYLLVVQPPEVRGQGIATFSLPVGEKDLRVAIGTFRNLLQNAGSDRQALTAQAHKLYNLLLRPAEHQFAGAARLLISPDGPLQTLPFAALVRRGRYLGEWKPIHSVLSATVYAEMKKARRPSADRVQSQVVAFGDPVYPRLPKDKDAAPAATLEVLAAVRRGLSLDPIPSTREEVEAIANLFPGTQVYLGREATEERAKTLGSQARLLHFACHGLLDERFPLDSALALTLPEHPGKGQENGLLQAWEIFESVRLDADLVTLSACDSGLGKEMGGEGLVGLTRAFQFAGARSVLASLWSVSDVSTADLMKRFYGYLREGRSKDEALRAAQSDLIRSQNFAHPYYWAAFQLTGDWK